MVSTSNSSQYLCPDFLSPMTSTADTGKSPLAMLAQTCQNIGAGPDSKKDKHGNSPRTKDGERRSGSALSSQVDENGNKTDHKGHHRPGSASASQCMPPSLPASLRAAACGLPPGSLPYHQAMAAAFSGYAGLGYGAYPFGLYPPSAAALNRPCVDPLCKGCTPVPGRPCPLGCAGCNSQTDLATQMLLSNPYASLLAAQYPGLSMPSSLSMFGIPPATPPVTATPTTSTQLSTSPSNSQSAETNVCKWTNEDGSLCLKSFPTRDELSAHVSSHATKTVSTVNQSSSISPKDTKESTPTPKMSPREKSEKASPKASPVLPPTTSVGPSAGPIRNTTSPRTAYLNTLRFHPYGKPPTLNGLPTPGLPPTSLPFSPYAAAMSALFAQRMPASLPHP